jgi:SAM-dependent methyltransferase
MPVDEAVIDRARKGILELHLTPTKQIPASWIQNIAQKKLLGLASAGGQQGPILAAAGARVTIVDLSPEQLKQDQICCKKFGLKIATIQSDAADLSMFEPASFDLILNPVSNCFFPNLSTVWRECARVLKPGGLLLYGFINPVAYQFDYEEANGGHYHLKYHAPYSDHESLSKEEKTRFIYPEAPLEFGHSLSDQISCLLHEGFVVEDLYEDNWGDERGLDKFFPSFIAIKARRVSI